MNNLKSWQNFLAEQALEFELNDREFAVLTTKFGDLNLHLSDSNTLDLLDSLHITKDTYVKTKGAVYKKFACSSKGRNALNQTHSAKVLHDCLRAKYQSWLDSYNPRDRDRYYISRCFESDCYRELKQSNAFVRVKAPQKMGKTLLLKRVLKELNRKGYTTLRYDFALGEAEIFSDYQRFIGSFCAGISEILGIEDRSAELWSDRLGVNQNATKYFDRYLLPQVNRPLVLGLDGLDRVLGHQVTAPNFCSLLRAWHDKNRALWDNLRLIVVHSTEVYSQSGLNINNSPLAGIGKVVRLTPFNRKQVEILAQRYGLSLTVEELSGLMNLMGGHPYLIRVSLEYMARQDRHQKYNPNDRLSWQEFFQLAPTDESLFINHLLALTECLQQDSELANAFAEVVCSDEPIPLPSKIGFKLLSLSLVGIAENNYFPMCDLCRQYFLTHIDELR